MSFIVTPPTLTAVQVGPDGRFLMTSSEYTSPGVVTDTFCQLSAPSCVTYRSCPAVILVPGSVTMRTRGRGRIRRTPNLCRNSGGTRGLGVGTAVLDFSVGTIDSPSIHPSDAV